MGLYADMKLSSPAHLHDLSVQLVAMSPSEFQEGGKGLQICYGIHQTPFGDCVIAATPSGICNLHFLDTSDRDEAAQLLQSEWPNADLMQDQQVTQEFCDRIFAGVDNKPLTVSVKGTDFQMQVWQALLQVPLGKTTTYQELAIAIGRPTAARAVGSAVGSNAVGYLIPCHRVIRADGELGGFRWGLQRKMMLLDWEANYKMMG